MRPAAFRSPLSHEELADLGRVTLNFGYAETLLNHIVSALLRLPEGQAKLSLIAPLATSRKVEIIKENLSIIIKNDVRARLESVCKRIPPLNTQRNQMIHGYWAFRVDEQRNISPASHSSKSPSKPTIPPSAISQLADDAALITQDLYHVMMGLHGHEVGEVNFPVNLWAGNGPPPSWFSEEV
jgi:hypothetical protein